MLGGGGRLSVEREMREEREEGRQPGPFLQHVLVSHAHGTLTYSSNKYFLSTPCVLGTVLGLGTLPWTEQRKHHGADPLAGGLQCAGLHPALETRGRIRTQSGSWKSRPFPGLGPLSCGSPKPIATIKPRRLRWSWSSGQGQVNAAPVRPPRAWWEPVRWPRCAPERVAPGVDGQRPIQKPWVGSGAGAVVSETSMHHESNGANWGIA